MLSLEEAKRLATEKFGPVDYQGEYPEFYLFVKVSYDKNREGFDNVWVGKYVERACDNPDEWYEIREEQSRLKGNKA